VKEKRPTPELLLHPIRIRVIQSLARGRRSSVRELAGLVDDVPQATLYRHVKMLAEAGVLAVVEERPARGTPERVYALVEGAASIGAAELAQATPEQHLRWFTLFLASLLGDFGRYVGSGAVDFAADGAGYRQVPLELDDRELAELSGRLDAALRPVLGNTPAPGRRRRMLTTIFIPEGGPES
jgi:DNA-binding transcriptional ArsR family regulator